MMVSSSKTCIAVVVALLHIGCAVRVVKEESTLEREEDPSPEQLQSTIFPLPDSYYTVEDKIIAAEALGNESLQILHHDESIEMAFKCGAHRVYFTTFRVLYKPKSIIRTRTAYSSIPYDSIKAYMVETSGSMLDFDSHLKLYLKSPNASTFEIGFRRERKGTFTLGRADIYEVGAFIAKKTLGLQVDRVSTRSSMSEIESVDSGTDDALWVRGAMAWVGGDASEASPEDVEKSFRKSVQLLGDDEKVLLAFTIGRDTMVMTTRRIIAIDVKGVTGRRINYMVIPYEAIKAFEVVTAGNLDIDAELNLWTDIPGYGMFTYDFRADKSDPYAINKVLSDKVLGSKHNGRRIPKRNKGDAQADKVSDDLSDRKTFDVFQWLLDHGTEVDPKTIEGQLREQDVLQDADDEKVQMAFRVGFDYNVLTNKRLMMVDKKTIKSLGGNAKVSYRSIPYTSMHGFAVVDGGHFELDSQIRIWTSIAPPKVPVCPSLKNNCMSYIVFQLAKGRSDSMAIHHLLSRFILNGGQGGGKSVAEYDGDRNLVEKIWDWAQDNAVQSDPAKAEGFLKELLQPGEHVTLAFIVGRDFHVWTDKRFFLFDRRRLRGTMALSIPYRAVQAFSVTTAGKFDNDAELEFWTDMPWMPHYTRDLRDGSYDFKGVMRVLGGHLSHLKPASFLDTTNPFGDFVRTLKGTATQQLDVDAANKMFHSDPPILLDDEEVFFVAQGVRDTIMLTELRTLVVDVHGLSGKRIEYRSVFHRSIGVFSVRTAGRHDVEQKMRLFSTAAAMRPVRAGFSKDSDVFAVLGALTEGIMNVHASRADKRKLMRKLLNNSGR